MSALQEQAFKMEFAKLFLKAVLLENISIQFQIHAKTVNTLALNAL